MTLIPKAQKYHLAHFWVRHVQASKYLMKLDLVNKINVSV